jgi:hypothetical protein
MPCQVTSNLAIEINKMYGAERPESVSPIVCASPKSERMSLAREYLQPKFHEIKKKMATENFGLDIEGVEIIRSSIQSACEKKCDLHQVIGSISLVLMKFYKSTFSDFKQFLADAPGASVGIAAMGQAARTPLAEIVNAGVGSGLSILNALFRSILKFRPNNLGSAEFKEAVSKVSDLAIDLSQIVLDALMDFDSSLYIRESYRDLANPIPGDQIFQDMCITDINNEILTYDRTSRKLGINLQTFEESADITGGRAFDQQILADPRGRAMLADDERGRAMLLHGESEMKVHGCPASQIIPLICEHYYKIMKQELFPHLDQILAV